MADWSTISSLATAGGTLVLAGATFIAVRSSHESTRITERALLAAIRPLLVSSRFDDPPQKVGFMDERWFKVEPGHAIADVTPDVIYLAFGVRNVGSGLAVLDRWGFRGDPTRDASVQPDVGDFHRLSRDLYIAAGDAGFWQGAIRDRADPLFDEVRASITARKRFAIDVLYGDHEGGQRTVTRFALTPRDDDRWITSVGKHWNLDRPDPR